MPFTGQDGQRKKTESSWLSHGPARYNDGMSLTTIEISQAEIFGRAIDCHADGLLPDVARFILQLKLHESDERRMNELAEKARQGLLSEAEEGDLEEFRRCGRLMELLKLKSRTVLDSP